MEPIVVEIQTPRLLAEAMAAAEAAAVEGGNPEQTADEYIKKHLIKLYFVSATRRQSYRRGDAMQAAQQWLLKTLGVKKWGQVDMDTIDKSIMVTWLAAWQAADILGALVKTENWDPPANVEDWAEVEDYIYNPALSMAWELNPQWAAERAEATEGNS